ncbi:hypothetical protein BpHYR1_012637 [Brachionus plicatilis]|uniref:Uncharacterized protein n=1 Tax=Brachionus plicatilis TaxID=10195 RepID=A0A3M7SV43_BRAPC|nr:hypothetical protein BpHYR1_012637 [Brachionus plicatilis]
MNLSDLIRYLHIDLSTLKISPPVLTPIRLPTQSIKTKQNKFQLSHILASNENVDYKKISEFATG